MNRSTYPHLKLVLSSEAQRTTEGTTVWRDRINDKLQSTPTDEAFKDAWRFISIPLVARGTSPSRNGLIFESFSIRRSRKRRRFLSGSRRRGRLIFETILKSARLGSFEYFVSQTMMHDTAWSRDHRGERDFHRRFCCFSERSIIRVIEPASCHLTWTCFSFFFFFFYLWKWLWIVKFPMTLISMGLIVTKCSVENWSLTVRVWQ